MQAEYLKMFVDAHHPTEIHDALVKTTLAIATERTMLDDPERTKNMKCLALSVIAAVGTPIFISRWEQWIQDTKTSVNETLSKWAEQWALSGSGKLQWETFVNKHTPTRQFKMVSSKQTCEMKIRQAETAKEFVETVVVWNGNGARARWNGKAELKQVVQAVDPDVLCFLEGKTDAENLLQLGKFREWATEAKYHQVNCYWSWKQDKKAHGNEGVILFSKVPCEVTYGFGNSEMDNQARALTAEFSDCIILFTYNPQGGFVEESLTYRAKWEEALISYIRTLRNMP